MAGEGESDFVDQIIYFHVVRKDDMVDMLMLVCRKML